MVLQKRNWNTPSVLTQGSPWAIYTWGDLSPPIWEGQVQGDKVLMGGLIRGHTDLMEGPNFDRLYHKLKSTVIVKLQLQDAIYRLRFY